MLTLSERIVFGKSCDATDLAEKFELVDRSASIFANYAVIHNCFAARVSVFFACTKHPYCEFHHQRQFLMEAFSEALAEFQGTKHTLAWCGDTLSLLVAYQHSEDLKQVIDIAIKRFNNIAEFYGNILSSQHVDIKILNENQASSEARHYS